MFFLNNKHRFFPRTCSLVILTLKLCVYQMFTIKDMDVFQITINLLHQCHFAPFRPDRIYPLSGAQFTNFFYSYHTLPGLRSAITPAPRSSSCYDVYFWQETDTWVCSHLLMWYQNSYFPAIAHHWSPLTNTETPPLSVLPVLYHNLRPDF